MPSTVTGPQILLAAPALCRVTFILCRFKSGPCRLKLLPEAFAQDRLDNLEHITRSLSSSVQSLTSRVEQLQRNQALQSAGLQAQAIAVSRLARRLAALERTNFRSSTCGLPASLNGGIMSEESAYAALSIELHGGASVSSDSGARLAGFVSELGAGSRAFFFN